MIWKSTIQSLLKTGILDWIIRCTCVLYLTETTQCSHFAGEHVYKPGNSDPFQQPQSAGFAGSQHLHYHRPCRDQAAHRDVAIYPQSAWCRQLNQSEKTRWGPAQTRCAFYFSGFLASLHFNIRIKFHDPLSYYSLLIANCSYWTWKAGFKQIDFLK